MQDINILSFVMVFALQCVGAFEHWRFMRAQGRVSGKFYSYMVSAYPGKSAATILLLGGSAWVSCQAGVGDNINPELVYALISTGQMPLATLAAIGASLVTGYGFDSRFNKADK